MKDNNVNINKNNKDKNLISMKKEYPFILLIRMIAFFDYRSGLIQHDGKTISVNKICKIMGLNYSLFESAFEVLKENNLGEIIEVTNSKIVIINKDIIDGIYKSKDLINKRLQSKRQVS